MAVVVDLFPVLPQQVPAVVVAVRSPDHRMNVLPIRDSLRIEVSKSNGSLMIELNQDDGAVNPVVVDRVVLRSADPSEIRGAEM